MPPHPGPRHPVRWFHTNPEPAHHYRAELASGKTLLDAVGDIARAIQCQAASLSLMGGSFSKLTFTTGDVETRPESSKQANYTYFRHWEECYLVSGAATYGLDKQQHPLIHCHAIFSNHIGTVTGGHLLPDECIVDTPIICHITHHPQALIKQAYDDETDHTIFHPIVKGNPHVF